MKNEDAKNIKNKKEQLKINVFGLLELSGELLSEMLRGFWSRLEAELWL